jgi:uncharacterized protein YjbJ (UPF0337 family)
MVAIATVTMAWHKKIMPGVAMISAAKAAVAMAEALVTGTTPTARTAATDLTTYQLLPGCPMEHVMSMDKDQVNGRVNQTEGKIKEVFGKVVGDEKLELMGKIQGVTGQTQAKFDDIKQEVTDSLKKNG